MIILTAESYINSTELLSAKCKNLRKTKFKSISLKLKQKKKLAKLGFQQATNTCVRKLHKL